MKPAFVFPRYKYPTGDSPLFFGVAYLASYLRRFSEAQVAIVGTTFNIQGKYIKNYLRAGIFDPVTFIDSDLSPHQNIINMLLNA